MKTTIQRVVQQVDMVKPNKYDDAQKINWLSEIEGRIYNELLKKHEGFEGVSFDGYDENTPGGQELLIQGTYSDVYAKWLMCQIDFHNAETLRYNGSATMFNAAWADLSNWVNRTYRPCQGEAVAKMF